MRQPKSVERRLPERIENIAGELRRLVKFTERRAVCMVADQPVCVAHMYATLGFDGGR
jgi:hypothetical protein